MSVTRRKERCKRGTRRNHKTGKCEEYSIKRSRCKKGTYKNKYLNNRCTSKVSIDLLKSQYKNVRNEKLSSAEIEQIINYYKDADEIMAKKNYIIAELGNMKFKPRYKSPFGGQKFYNLYEQALDRLQAWAKYNDASSNIKI